MRNSQNKSNKEIMGVWTDYNWDYQKRLNGVLIALLFPLPFLYFSSTLVANCPEQSFFSWDVTASVCSAGTHFAVLSLVLLFVPMYFLALLQGNVTVIFFSFFFFFFLSLFRQWMAE